MKKIYKLNFINRLNKVNLTGLYLFLFILGTAGFNNYYSQCTGATYSFLTCGATGINGPTQAQVNAAYIASNLNGSVVCTAGIQNFVVPVTGSYLITAAGAGGGNANGFGGRGRIVQGTINLIAGQTLKIIVGQKGILTTSSGGGGGSYVVNAAGNNTILVGGGGAGFVGALGAAIPSSDGNIGTAGNNANDFGGGGGLGGINGNGGTGANGGWGGGGGGFNTDGTDASACVNTRGFCFLTGGLGGNTCNNTTGGFGGGGGTHGNTGGGGGGGGFSGGGGSTQNLVNSVGGGGGSFFNATMTGTVNVGVNLNDGFVTITQPSLSPCVGMPTPGSAAANPTLGCASFTTNLSLTGAVPGCSLTYQWQSAPALAGPYANIVGATASSTSVPNPVTTFYRCIVTCAGNNATSTPVQVSNVPCSCAGGTYSFTNAGATGLTGPTQAQVNAAYLGTSLAGSVVCPLGIQSFVVPTSGNYQIIAAGAGGGNANGFGGRGIIVQGNINLTAGQTLKIIVGQKGILTNSSGGGGGSYVVDAAGNNTLLVAGGGAGFVGALGAAIPSSDGNISTAGQNANDFGGGGGVGGINGNGGTGANGGWGGGGGGFNTDGTDASACFNTRGFCFLTGGAGGNTCNNTTGGFGGGGGTHGNTGGGGGGGGFSGGGGSTQNLVNSVGGGGGSFFNAAMTSTSTTGYTVGMGFVTIIQPFLPACAGTPTAGNAVANPSTSCVSYTSNLTLAGAVAGCNQTYQWMSAPAPGGPYTAIPGATLISANVNVTVTTYYQCTLSCSGFTAVSGTATAAIPPCVGTPTAGNSVANPTTGCSTFTTNLNLVGNVVTCGLTYQWQSAPAPGGPFSNIAGATSPTASISNSITTYYRCILSCGGSTASSSTASCVNTGSCVICPAQLDNAVAANGASTFTMATNFPNELVMITYAGWNGPGSGPVTVDGVNATLVSIANNGNSGTTEVYAKTVAAVGVHTIICTETGYSYPPYGINFSAGFYVTGGCALTLANITTTVVNTIACVTGGSIVATIVTAQPNTLVYTSAEINNGQGGNFPIAWTNANFLGSWHIGNGIDAGHGYTVEAVAGTYSVVATNTSLPNNGCGGLTIILVGITPCSCAVPLPVGVDKFECIQTSEGMKLNWKVSSESKSSYYTIERSPDGSSFAPIAKINASGTSQIVKDYYYVDSDARNGNNFYRLTDTELDGSVHTYDIIGCNLHSSLNVTMYPNPNSGAFKLLIDNQNDILELRIMNSLGKIVSVQAVSKGTNEINMSGMAKGLYYYSIYQNNQSIKAGKIAVD